jgi:hypothetical protein
MATIVTRAGKGSTLTHAEMDANFNNLNNEVSGAVQNTGNETIAGVKNFTDNVGIGTNSPDNKLVVDGAIALSYNPTVSLNGIKRDGVTSEYFANVTGTAINVIHRFTGFAGVSKMSITQGGDVAVAGSVTANNLFGQGQSWQDVSASRSLSTTYYNTTGRPITVIFAWGENTNNVMGFRIQGVNVVAQSYTSTANETSMTFIIPPGASYSSYSTGLTYWKWYELR